MYFYSIIEVKGWCELRKAIILFGFYLLKIAKRLVNLMIIGYCEFGVLLEFKD